MHSNDLGAARSGPNPVKHDAAAGDRRAPALAGIASRERGTAPGGGTIGASRWVRARRRRRSAVVAFGLIGTLGFGGTVAVRNADAATGPARSNGAHAYGAAPDRGPAQPMDLRAPIVGIAAHPGGDGYWLVASDGGVFAFGDARFQGSTGADRLNQPVVGMTATPSGDGYWLVASDGGVFAFGDARFQGSTGADRLNQPVVGMAATPSGDGYWLVASDGGVFAFGDAKFYGSTGDVGLRAPVVGIAPTEDGQGYWLVARDGGVFAFGAARFRGSAFGAGVNDVSGIAATGDGGYIVAHASGAVDAFGTAAPAAGALADSAGAPTVGIAYRRAGGYWSAQAAGPGPVTASTSLHGQPFLVCTRSHESSSVPPLYDTGYAAVDPSGTYRGAYQFSRSTWNNTARHAGRPDLVGVDPASASVADQDSLAWDLYQWQGASPWLGRCAGK